MKNGDRVVCVDAGIIFTFKPNLIEGREYIVYGVNHCVCGHEFIDVGHVPSVAPETICRYCKHVAKNDGIKWLDAIRFRKVEEKREYKVVKSNIEIEETILS